MQWYCQMAFGVDDIGIALAGEHIHHQRDALLRLLAACPVVATASSIAFVAASGLSAMVALTVTFVVA